MARKLRHAATLLLVLILGAARDIAGQMLSANPPSARTGHAPSSESGLQTAFEVRFLEFDHVYLSLQPGSLLTKGMTLLVRRSGASTADVIAELKVTSVSSTSAICEVLVMNDNLQGGDVAYLTSDEIAALRKQLAPASPTVASVPASPKPITVTAPTVVNEVASVTPARMVANATSAHSALAVEPTKALSTPTTLKTTQQQTSAASNNAITSSPAERKSANSLQSVSASAPVNPPAPGASGSMSPGSAASPAAARALPAVIKNSMTEAPNVSHLGARVDVASTRSLSMPQMKEADNQSNGGSAAPTAKSDLSTSQVANEQPSANVAETTPSEDIALPSQDGSRPNIQTIFKIKFVAQDTVYLSAGTGTGLTPGMKLVVKHSAADVNEKGTLAKASQSPTVAELQVLSVATSSSVCAVQAKRSDIQPGDLAFMDEATAELLAEKKALSATRKYPQVVTFNEGDPLEEEARNDVPRPPLPEVNRIRGRFGFDYGSINSVGSVVSNNSQMGMVVRADFTRIGGSYWSLSGYWRGRLNNSSVEQQPTLQDLINRTYHLNFTYNSPTSPWVAGFGRLYLPWATSLDTIDGGYFGRKAGKHLLLGLFAGSTPDPTSWDYNPDRRLGGVFLNLEAGSFDSFRISSTSGVALSTLLWKVDRPFIFFENGLYFKRYLSLYDSTQADDPRPAPGITAPGPGLSRNFLTLRFQPHERLSFDVDHNYFRDVPTFSTALIATGLLDKYLFQGLSAGARVEPIRHVTFYASVGKSSRTGDASSSWNEMYGVTLAHIPRTGLRVDVRTSKFDSSFGNGKYRSVSLSRSFNEAVNLDVQVGQQFLTSQLSSQTESHFINSTLDGNLGRNYFVQGAYTVERGGTFNHNQWTVTFGYRFDNHGVGLAK